MSKSYRARSLLPAVCGLFLLAAVAGCGRSAATADTGGGTGPSATTAASTTTPSGTVSGSPAPATAPATGTDGIRGFDFANATWHVKDAFPGHTTPVSVTLVHGHATVHTVPTGGEQPSQVDLALGTAQPIYADANHDGHEDAAVPIELSINNGFFSAWYIWLWQAHGPVQTPRPMAVDARCGDIIELIRAEPDGFFVSGLVRRPAQACAEQPDVPVGYTVAVRDGYPARIRSPRLRPQFGPAEPCVPQIMTDGRAALETDVLRLGPEPEAPLVVPATTRYTSYKVGERVAADPTGQKWQLALGTTATGATVCGWLRLARAGG